MVFMVLNLSLVRDVPPLVIHSLLTKFQFSAPAKKAISYEARKWDHTNTYFRNGSVNPDRLYKQFGPPSPEVEHAWENLIQCELS